jgi:DNA-binding response OmpR family regulator
VTVNDRPVSLTPIERELLRPLAAQGGDLVDHGTLVRIVWPARRAIDLDLLRTHLGHLNGKLIAAGHPGIVNVRGSGYRLRADGAPRQNDAAQRT